MTATCAVAMCLMALPSPRAGAQGDGDPGPPGHGGSPPAMVRVGDVMMQRVQDRRQVVGRLVEVRRSQVAAQREGRIIEINVDEGDAVTGGKTVLARTDDVWAKLDVRVAEAALQRANAEVEASQANLDLAQRHHKFLMLLDATNAAKKKEVDDARDQVRLAKAAISNARAILLDA